MTRTDVYTCDSKKFRANKAKILSAIANQALTKHEIAFEVGLNVSTVTNYMYFLHQAEMVYIHSYDVNGGRPTKRFMFGCQEDAVFNPKRPAKYKPKVTASIKKKPRCDVAAAWFHPTGATNVMQSRV